MSEIIGCLEVRRRLIREEKGRREKYQDDFFLLAQRALAALRALCLRSATVCDWTRALPPFLPRLTAAGFFRFIARD
jgi:hypothetical protein